MIVVERSSLVFQVSKWSSQIARHDVTQKRQNSAAEDDCQHNIAYSASPDSFTPCSKSMGSQAYVWKPRASKACCCLTEHVDRDIPEIRCYLSIALATPFRDIIAASAFF